MNKLTNLFTLTLFSFLIITNTSFAQCNIHLQSPDTIKITDTWGTQTQYLFPLKFTAPVAGEYTLTAGTLKEATSNVALPGDNITLTPSKVQLKKGETKTLEVLINATSKAGAFTGHIKIQAPKDSCEKRIPLVLKLTNSQEITATPSASLLKVINRPGLRGFVPPNIRQDRFNILVANKSNAKIELDTFNLALIHPGSGQVLTETDFEKLAPESISKDQDEFLQFKIKDKAQPFPGTYTGKLHLFFKDYKPITVDLQLGARSPVWAALIVLILGVIFGRMVNVLNASEKQLALVGPLTRLRLSITGLKDSAAVTKLIKLLEQLENQVETTTEEEAITQLEKEIATLKQKVDGVREWESLYLRVQETLGKEEIHELSPKLLHPRDLFIAGEFKEAETCLVELNEQIKEQLKDDGKADEPGMEELVNEMFLAMDNTISRAAENQSARQETTPIAGKKSFSMRLKKIGSWFLWVISGHKSSLRLKYWFFKPLVMAVLFIGILLIGLDEIYIQGDNSFGANGLYDFLKLFVWGAASDIFTSGLIGNGLTKLQNQFNK